MKRVCSILVMIAMTTTLVVGCGTKKVSTTSTSTPAGTSGQSTTAPTNGKELKGTVHWVTNRVDMATTTHKDLADKFMKANPGVKVEIEGIKDTEQVLRTRFAAGQVDDVTFVPGFIQKSDWNKYFAPLDDLGYTKDSIFFYESYKAPDGKHYAFQTMVSYNAMFYIKSAFKAAGIAKTPTTEEEFLAACEKLKAAGITPLAINFKDKWPMLWYYRYYPVLTSGDPNYVFNLKDSDVLLDKKGQIVHAFDLLDNMNQKGYLEKDLMSTNYDNIFRKDMATGKVAMAFLGTWFPQQLVDMGAKADDIGAFPFPGSKVLGAAGDWAFGVAKDSKSLDAAKAFLKYITDEGRYAKSIGSISPLKSLAPSEGYVKELLSANLPIVEEPSTPDDYSLTLTKSKTNECQEIMQEYLLAKGDKEKQQSILDKANKAWADARKEVAATKK
jgi:raffinose/stachyose/melibiose transport system substrate-binding protein